MKIRGEIYAKMESDATLENVKMKIEPTLENVIYTCEDRFLKHVRFSDLKNLRLVNKGVLFSCNDFINTHLKITVNVTQRNFSAIWRYDSELRLKKASGLSIKWHHAYTPFLSVPNKFIYVTKFLLELHGGGDFRTFDVFLSQLPNLEYFGFSYSTLEDCGDPKWWDTDRVYENLKELEVITRASYPLPYFNFYPLIRFIKRHPNIKTLRTQYSLLRIISRYFIKQNIQFENIYVHWDWFFIFFDHFRYVDSIFTPLTLWFSRGLYENIYLQSTDSQDPDLREHAFLMRRRINPGIRQLRYMESHHCERFKYINILDSSASLPNVMYDKASWFGLF